MASSPLVTQWIGCNPTNYNTGRGGYSVNGIVIHHAVCLNIGAMDSVFQRANYGGSAHYGVWGNTIHQYVDENDTAWHCSNYWGNQNTIGIECVNSALGGDYPVADDTLETLCKLVADIAKRYGLGNLYVNPSEDCPKISGHRDWYGASTACMPLDATEVLTDKGFVSLGNVTKKDKVAQWDQKTYRITFTNPKDIVKPYMAKVKMIRNTELTEDHDVFTKKIEHRRNKNRGKWTGEYEKKKWGSSDRFSFPTEASYKGKGLGLTLDELEYLMWVQADGHYMVDEECLYGVEFHFAKQRKIDRVIGLLEDLGKEYVYTEQSDGTVKLRVYGKNEVVWCEKYLNDKEFTWDWLELSDEQYERFREVLVLADGCEANSSYSSKSLKNISIVQAILQLHGQPSHVYYGENYPRLYFSSHAYSLDGRNGTHTRETEVSCLTMPKGSLVIRQYGRIQIVGNCPGNYLYARLQYIADRANQINNPPKKEIKWHDVPTTTMMVDGVTHLYNVETDQQICEVSGEVTFVQMTDDNYWVRTQYSKDKGLNNGIAYHRLVPIPEPTPAPTVEWVDVPETTMRVDGVTHLYNVITLQQICDVTGDVTFVQKSKDGYWVRTEYSKEKGLDNGIQYHRLLPIEPEPQPEPTPEPEPEPTPEPTPDPGDDTPNWFIRFIKALGEFFINLFSKKEK